ncbi:DUF6504 family protein [Rathayibacter sp. YIM 133350]|uniref:DUF6504 family protein n=1 Tax=Rathayibacter sp. YIM 133350 TaxID=3131992 RepID=UPI00307F8DC2
MQVDETVAVWTSESGEPRRLVWRSRRFRVNDSPTALVGPCDWWHPMQGHRMNYGRPPLQISGWRFQASTEEGETHVFDVQHDGADDRWKLVRVFD